MCLKTMIVIFGTEMEKSERRDQTTTRFSRSDDNRCGVCSVAREAFVSHVSPVP